jgi:hypothetical protein
MHSVFSAQTRRFGHSHSFDSQIGNTDVSLALGNGEVAAAASIRSEESICQTRRFAPTVGQSMSVTGISRQAQRNCSVDKVPFCLRKVRAIIAREYSRSKTPRSQPRRQAIHDLAFNLEPATACLKASGKTLVSRTGDIHSELAPQEVAIVELLAGSFRPGFIGHCDEGEAPGLAGRFVGDDGGFAHLAGLTKDFA